MKNKLKLGDFYLQSSDEIGNFTFCKSKFQLVWLCHQWQLRLFESLFNPVLFAKINSTSDEQSDWPTMA